MVDSIGQQTPYYVRQAFGDQDRMAGSVAVWKNNGDAQNTPASSSSASLSLSEGQSSTSVTAPSLSFGEMLDVVNPLHHLPVVGSVYRELTGDNLSSVARVAGGTLYGGPLGGLTSIVSAAVEEHAGQDVASAMVDQASVVNRYKDAFADEPRMAGYRPIRQDEEVAHVIPQDKPIQTVAIDSAPMSQIVEDNDVFDRMNSEPIKAITQVHIEVAQATAQPRFRQQWNFNS